MRTVFFHEDDYGQVEILPSEARTFCAHEMRRIDEFAAVHWDGEAFTDIYLRCEPQITLASRKIGLADLRETIGGALAPFDRVFTGYGSHREPCRSAHAWGLDDSAAVFAGVERDDLVKDIWLALWGIPADEIGEWGRALRSLPHSSELLLADWNRSEVVLLDDEPGLVSYLRGYHS